MRRRRSRRWWVPAVLAVAATGLLPQVASTAGMTGVPTLAVRQSSQAATYAKSNVVYTGTVTYTAVAFDLTAAAGALAPGEVRVQLTMTPTRTTWDTCSRTSNVPPVTRWNCVFSTTVTTVGAPGGGWPTIVAATAGS